MRKLGYILFISIAAAATHQILIQPLLRPGSAGRHHVLRRARLSFAAPRSSETGPAFYTPVSGYVTDADGRGVRPILGFRVYASLGGKVDLGGSIRSVLSSPNQNYLVALDNDGTASLWTPDGDELLQTGFPSDATQTTLAKLSPSGFSLALVSKDRRQVQVFGSLPANPTFLAAPSLDDLGGLPVQLAVADDGSLLYTLTERGRDELYLWQQGSAARLVYSAPAIASVAFAPSSGDAVVAEGAGQQVTILRSANAYAATSLTGDGLANPVAAEFSRDRQHIVVANADSRTVQLFALNGTLERSAICNCQPQLTDRMIGNAVFRLTDFDGSGIMLFDGDAEPAMIAGAMIPAPAVALTPADQVAPQSGGPAANLGSSAVSGSVPSNNCGAPVTQGYYATGSAVYPWINLTALVSTDTVTARLVSGSGAFVGSAVVLSRPSTVANTATSSCFYSSSPISLANVNPADYTMQFFLNNAGTPISNANQLMTVVVPSATISTSGSARATLPGNNQQAAVATIPISLRDQVFLDIAPSFSASGVQNALAGSPYDCRLTTAVSVPISLTSAVTVPISAGATQSGSFNTSAGTVAGTCTIGVSRMTFGSTQAALTLPASSLNITGLQMTNAAAAPVLNTPSITTPAGNSNFTIQLTGWSTTRDLTSLTFTFNAKSGYAVSSPSVTTDVTSAASTWYTGSASAATGGSFLYNANFSVSNGTSSNISSVSITATSRQGTSSAVTVNFP